MEDIDNGGVRQGTAEPVLPSCDGCRTRKLKCSRQRPSCSNCRRLDESCFYDSARSKPGLKSGTVDKLHRRMEVIERALLRQDRDAGSSTSLAPGSPSQDRVNPSADHEAPATAALSTLAMQVQHLSSSISLLTDSIVPGGGLKSSMSPLSTRHNDQNGRGKRKRTGSEDRSPRWRENHSSERLEALDVSAQFFTGRGLEQLLDTYFTNIHPWIPMIHMTTFKRQLQARQGAAEPRLILRAIFAASLRLLNGSAVHLSADQVDQEIQRSRNMVITKATDGLTVENLQALTIIAFMDIGNGEPLRALPLVASLTRTAEYLQLSVEEGDADPPTTFLGPKSLPPPTDWIEQEERRRVFWNIFILDRICSVLAGWNIGLTADNVSRRLPMCGARWNQGQPAVSPYFGVWDKSFAKIGNSLAFLSTQYPSPGQSVETNGQDFDTTGPSRKQQSPTSHMDTSAIGAFAYGVESLESLCRINMYFLNQTIDFSNRQEVSCWLTRFKELDLRLIHWKTFLPNQWKDPNVPPQETTALDPNMTLAHITHNTSMILLHQRIGYPEAQLKDIKLPSFYSAETCQSAAVEIANIASNYLARAPKRMPLSPHFAFCCYISGRVLLVHSQFYGLALDPNFSILVDCLDGMSRRWFSCKEQGPTPALSTQMATHLQSLRKRCLEDAQFILSVVGPLESETSHPPHDPILQSALTRPEEHQPPPFPLSPQPVPPPMSAPCGPSHVAPPRPDLFNDQSNEHWALSSDVPGLGVSNNSTGSSDDLFDILQTLSDHNFAEMDRVISFGDFNFEL